MLQRLKQSPVFGVTATKLNGDLPEKESRTYLRSVLIHTMFKIDTKIPMIGKSIYLRSVKRVINAKQETSFGSIN